MCSNIVIRIDSASFFRHWLSSIVIAGVGEGVALGENYEL